MGFIEPEEPPYDPFEWQDETWIKQFEDACKAWALQGYGAPIYVYLFYVIKIGFYIALWCFFCSFTSGLGDPRTIISWWSEPIAFKKAILWSMAFEGLGLGCGSGPLTARYHPIFGGFLYFLRPGTIKRPLIPEFPVIGREKRSLLDVSLYALHYGFLFYALTRPELTVAHFLPIVILLPILGLIDKTLFLASRGEHYYVTVVCFLFVGDWIAGAMAGMLALWIWAAISKLHHHYPYVLGVMTSNSPLTPWTSLRKLFYREYPDDLRPSNFAYGLASVARVLEVAFPLLLLLGSGGWVTTIGLLLMVLFHVYITSNFPMGIPVEWNVQMVYGGFFLFGHYSDVFIWNMDSLILAVFLVVMLLFVPLIGHSFPSIVSFLVSMRYYAGNWPYSIWLFKSENESWKKLDENLINPSRWPPDQLRLFYDEETVVATLSKIPAFRAMHLHGRALQDLLPKAVDDVDDYQLMDGELIAGMTIGWNFGDGHLHDEELLRTLQNQCDFEEGELRCIFVESQPIWKPTLHWRIEDARTGQLDEGQSQVEELLELQPWPEEKFEH